MFIFLFLLIHMLSLVLFTGSMIRYCYSKHKNKKNPGTYCQENMKGRRTDLIISSIILGVFAIIDIGLFILLSSAIAYM